MTSMTFGINRLTFLIVMRLAFSAKVHAEEDQLEHSSQDSQVGVIPKNCFICDASFDESGNQNLWRSCEECSNWCCSECAISSISHDAICCECVID